jgi:microcystin-dependent protein
MQKLKIIVLLSLFSWPAHAITNRELEGKTIRTATGNILTLPTGTSDTLVGKATTDTLTNKTLSAASNTISLTSNTLSGQLPVASGGTGAATLTANNVLLGNGTSAVQFVAPGSSGNVLTSNGTTWSSTTPVTASKPSGELFMFAGSTCPTGSLAADGSSLLRSGGTSCGGGACATLFAAIGTAWGAADGTHFNLPDLRGKFPRGFANGSSNDPDRASRTACATGGATADNIGTCEADAFQDHAHLDALNTGADKNSWGFDGSWATVTGSSATTSAAQHSSPASSIGGQRTSTETRPINVSVLYCVQY